MFGTYAHRDRDLGHAIEELKALHRLWHSAAIEPCPEGVQVGILIIPGMGALDKTTAKTRKFFEKFGYKAFATNYNGPINFTSACLRQLESNVAEVAAQLKPKGHLFLIGHSAGSVIARGISKKMPEQVSGVFSLGGVYRTKSGSVTEHLSRCVAERYFRATTDASDFDHYFDSLTEVGDVPNVSISTNRDDFVPDGISISDNPEVKNVMVMQSNRSLLGKATPNVGPSHMGLIYNIPALKIIADEIGVIVKHSQQHMAPV